MIETKETRSGVMVTSLIHWNIRVSTNRSEFIGTFLEEDIVRSQPASHAKVQSHKSRAYPHAACDDGLIFIARGSLEARRLFEFPDELNGRRRRGYLLVSLVVVDSRRYGPLR
jgi:hypothetical protein